MCVARKRKKNVRKFKRMFYRLQVNALNNASESLPLISIAANLHYCDVEDFDFSFIWIVLVFFLLLIAIFFHFYASFVAIFRISLNILSDEFEAQDVDEFSWMTKSYQLTDYIWWFPILAAGFGNIPMRPYILY